MGVLNLGYPLWLLLSVLVVFALLLYYVLRGRVSEGWRVALAVVLAPVCTVWRGSGRRGALRLALPALRDTDRSRKSRAPYIASTNPRCHEPRDDRPHSVPVSLPERDGYRLPGRLGYRFSGCFAVSFGDGFGLSGSLERLAEVKTSANRALQHFS